MNKFDKPIWLINQSYQSWSYDIYDDDNQLVHFWDSNPPPSDLKLGNLQ